MHKRGLCRHAVSVCLSVCVSFTFVDHVKMNKHIFEMFSPSSCHTILVFHTKRGGDIPTGTALTGTSNAGGVGRNRDSEPISSLTACNRQQASCCKHGRHRLASCDKSLVLVVSGDVDCGRRRRNVYDKKPQRNAEDNRTAHLTACSDKSVAYVTNNKRLYSRFCSY